MIRFLPHQFKAFMRFLESLRTELVSVRASFEQQIGSIKDGQEANRQAQEKIQARLSELRVSEDEMRKAHSYRKKNFTVQVILASGTCGAFITAAIYAAIAASTYGKIAQQTAAAQNTLCELQRQTSLMQTQVEVSMAAT